MPIMSEHSYGLNTNNDSDSLSAHASHTGGDTGLLPVHGVPGVCRDGHDWYRPELPGRDRPENPHDRSCSMPGVFPGVGRSHSPVDIASVGRVFGLYDHRIVA